MSWSISKSCTFTMASIWSLTGSLKLFGANCDFLGASFYLTGVKLLTEESTLSVDLSDANESIDFFYTGGEGLLTMMRSRPADLALTLDFDAISVRLDLLGTLKNELCLTCGSFSTEVAAV